MAVKWACSSFYDRGEAGLRSAKFKVILVFTTGPQKFYNVSIEVKHFKHKQVQTSGE